jgi:phosphohistidine phosphatase
MELILWRHADAADGYPDAERELTDKGLTQAKRMAFWLNARLPAEVLILASPARRAQQTAAALQRAVTTCAAVDTSADAQGLLKAARWPRGGQTTLIVGHQPTLGHAASLMLTGAEGELSIKKGAVWWLAARPRQGALHAVLRAVMTPDLLRKD